MIEEMPFFPVSISQLLIKLNVTGMINHVFISFSAVEINGLKSYIHLRYKCSTLMLFCLTITIHHRGLTLSWLSSIYIGLQCIQRTAIKYDNLLHTYNAIIIGYNNRAIVVCTCLMASTMVTVFPVPGGPNTK